MWAWGQNFYGYIGDGTTEDRLVPIMVDKGYKTISAGGDFSFGLKADNSLWGWGDIFFGFTGADSIEYEALPVLIDFD